MNRKPTSSNGQYPVHLIFRAILLLSLSFGLSTCGAKKSLDKAIAILDEAIYSLEVANANWQEILQDTYADLMSAGLDSVGNQVKQIIDRTIEQGLTAEFCSVDFMRQRIHQELYNIRAQLKKEPSIYQLIPVVCMANAAGKSTIDLSNYPDSVNIVGYDMGTNIKVVLEEGSEKRDISNFYNPGLYNATITLGANGPALTAKSKILLLWKENDQVLHGIGVTRPKPKECKVIETTPPVIVPEPVTFNPPLVKGDADFHGNGPWVTAKAQLVNLGDRAIVWVYMNAKEDETNGSTADGSMAFTRIVPPGGYQIYRINADVKAVFNSKGRDHNKFPANGIGGNFYKPDGVTFIGDTEGDDICLQVNCGGYYTGIEINFQGLRVELIETENCTPVENNPPSEIDKKNASLQNRLGPAVGPELYTLGNIGRMRHFDGGWIYWTPKTGAHFIWGSIYEKWASLGYEAGFLGFPNTDELITPDGKGRYNHFEGGSIYWTPWTGAHEVHGAIREEWARLDWEKGPLGYPVSDEYIGDRWIGGASGDWTRVSEFEHGWIVWAWEEGTTIVYK